MPSKLSQADKFDLQQYITRCYGSLTTFNILFKNKNDQFPNQRSGQAERLRLYPQSEIRSCYVGFMTTAGALLQLAFYARTGMRIAAQPPYTVGEGRSSRTK